MAMPSKYIHLIRAMHPGDVIYLIATGTHFDRTITSSCYRARIKVRTKNVVAVETDRVTACHLLRIERLSPAEKEI